MKKIVSLILTVLLVFSLFVTPAFAGAAYNSDVMVSASLDNSEIEKSSSAQTIVLSIGTSKQVDLFSIGYKVEVPTGWSITKIESGTSNISYEGFSSTTTGVISWYALDAKNQSTSTIGKITINVPANTDPGNYSIKVTKIELATEGQNSDNPWMSKGTASAQLTVKTPKVLTGISVKTAPSKTSYVAGQNFDPAGMVIEKKYNDNSTATATGWTVTDGNSLTEGKTSVIISYTEGGVTKTVTQAITVVPKVITDISVKTAPTKTSYVAGQNFDPAGMVIEKKYNDNSTATATGWTVTDGNSLTEGKTSVIISYTEGGVTKTVTQAITVVPKALAGISVKTAPNKTDYIAGQDFNSAGMVITATYNDGTSVDKNGGWTIIGGMGLSTGTTSVTISYTEGDVEKTCTQAITVAAKAVDSISLNSKPWKTKYSVGDRFVTSGIVITVKYNDGTSEDISSGFIVTPSGSLTARDTEIVITYGGKTTTCHITIEEEILSDTSTLYSVKTSENYQNGSVTIDKNSAGLGSTVTITVTPDEGYELRSLTAIDKKGRQVVLTKVDDTTYSFRMPSAEVTISAVFKKIGSCMQDSTCPAAKFMDLDLTEWYHDGVHYCVENNLMQGVSDTSFNPDGTTTRAQIVTILWRMEGMPVVNYNISFNDVPANEWYAEAVRWAQSTGIVEGYNSEKFGSGDPITREQMATILYRFAKNRGIDVANTNTLDGFTDADEISAWALDAMSWANAVGLVNGRTATTLVPEVSITRAEAATMVQRYCVAFQK